MHTNPLYNVFTTILKRDLFFGLRRSGELVNSLIFFLIVVTMFPFALGTESALLRDIYPGVIWVAALLSVTMSLDRMFNSDFEDGTLEQMLLSQHPTTFIAMVKIVAHWLLTGVPLIIATPQHKPGQRTDALVELLDLYPTLADLCELRVPLEVEGISLVPLLSDQNARGKEFALTQTPRPNYLRGKLPKVMG